MQKSQLHNLTTNRVECVIASKIAGKKNISPTLMRHWCWTAIRVSCFWSRGTLALWMPILVSFRWTADRSWSSDLDIVLMDGLGWVSSNSCAVRCDFWNKEFHWTCIHSCALQVGLASFSKLRSSSAIPHAVRNETSQRVGSIYSYTLVFLPTEFMEVLILELLARWLLGFLWFLCLSLIF